MNVVLIGYRCAGKSEVGRRLALCLQRPFVDTDDLIEERRGALISDIVKSDGWDYFRTMEKKIIEEISKGDRLIIAPGGGVVLDAENVVSLRKNGLVIWLKADPKILLKRMGEDPQTNSRRPALTRKGALEELKEVMAHREPFYERAADVQLDTSTLELEAVVKRVLSVIEEKRGA